jgi:enoyl-[acyl-carrier protein] reductase II
VAALLALGAEAVQLGTRFIATPEASVHDNYKRAVLAAEVHDTCLVGPASLPIRQMRNAFTQKWDAASPAEREELFKGTSLRRAALEGDVEWGKVEIGQSAGLVEDIVPAAALVQRLVQELEDARRRLANL